MPSGFSVGTAASLALDVNQADISLPLLTSSAAGVRLTQRAAAAATVSITNVSLAYVSTGFSTVSY